MFVDEIKASLSARSDFPPAVIKIVERPYRRTTKWRGECCDESWLMPTRRGLIALLAAHVEANHGDEVASFIERRTGR